VASEALSEQTRSGKSLDVKLTRSADDNRHPPCEAHIKRHFCVAGIMRRRKVSAELTELCGGVR